MINKKALILSTIVMFLAWPVMSAAQSSGNLNGKILLQVEKNGEAWYVDPQDGLRYFLNRPDDAFQIMRERGVGVSDQEISRIQPSLEYLNGQDSDEDGLPDDFEKAMGTDPDDPDTSGNGYTDKTELKYGYNPLKKEGELQIDEKFAQEQAGKILLQTEQNGEAWYINPEDNKRYFLGRPADAFQIMRNLGLGISDQDLGNIEKGHTEEKTKIDLTISSNKNIYKEGDNLELSIELSSNRDIDPLNIKAKGISNEWDHYYFDKTKQVSVEKNDPETINISSTIPSCSSCTGIKPGSHHIEVSVYQEEEKLNEEKINFEIRTEVD